VFSGNERFWPIAGCREGLFADFLLLDTRTSFFAMCGLWGANAAHRNVQCRDD
jgi:hypothetical protein